MTNFKGQFLENYTFITFRSHYEIDAVFKIDKDIWLLFCLHLVFLLNDNQNNTLWHKLKFINFLLINKIYLLFLGYLSIIRNTNVSLNKGARSSSAGRDSFDDVKTNKKDATADRGSSGK